ncbi:hypothetical protein [Natronoarchaeum rubrum]|uniref:hypothetical protein n=1 Tax=Natronoarchaeum rubrum TaxID=755311 RepID=UPI0021111397|nr:hypothetical protein [Natronoarchaeum rubrum]
MTETNAGHQPHDQTDVSPAQRPDDAGRCPCGAKADGYDAQLDEATCEDCAELWADGGLTTTDVQGGADA